MALLFCLKLDLLALFCFLLCLALNHCLFKIFITVVRVLLDSLLYIKDLAILPLSPQMSALINRLSEPCSRCPLFNFIKNSFTDL